MSFQQSIHHHYLNKIIKPREHKSRIDYVIYVIVFVWPLSNLPQLHTVWIQGQTNGVSMVSRSTFAILSLIWMIYGMVHREYPIIIMNAILVVVQSAVVVGVLIN